MIRRGTTVLLALLAVASRDTVSQQMQVDTTTPRTPQQIAKYAQDWDRTVRSIDSLTAATMKSDTLLLADNTGGTVYAFPHAGIANEPLFRAHASWGRQVSVREGVFYYVGGTLVHARYAEGISGRPLSWQTLYFAPNGPLVRWVRTDGTVVNRGAWDRAGVIPSGDPAPSLLGADSPRTQIFGLHRGPDRPVGTTPSGAALPPLPAQVQDRIPPRTS